MIKFGQDYYYHEGKIFKEIKPDTRRRTNPRYCLKDKTGKRHWITIKEIESILKNKKVL